MQALTTTQSNLQTLSNDFISYIDTTTRTTEAYKKNLGYFFNYLVRENEAQPNRQTIQAYKNELMARGLKNTTVQAYLNAVKVFFNYLEEMGLYSNIASRVKAPKIDTAHKKDYLTASQTKQVIQSITSPRDKALIALLATTGLRTIEVARATIADMQTRAGATVLYIQGKGKQDKAQFVKISPAVEQAIRLSFTGRTDLSPESPLFSSESNRGAGQALTTRSISRIVKQALKANGLDSERLTAHSLRHTAVTLALLSGQSLEQVQQFARHSNINTTMIYNHAINADSNECSNAVAEAIGL